MSDEIYFFTHSYTYDVNAMASTPGTSVGDNIPENTIDYNHSTYWETVDALPQLKIDLSAAQTIDSIWFKSSNVSKYRLYYSTDDIIYTAVHVEQDGNVNGYNYDFEFTQQTARYWRLDITQELVGGNNTLIYEVFLMKHRLTLSDTDDSVPSRMSIQKNDTIGGSYVLADGSTTTYAGQKAYAIIEMQFEYTPKTNRDNLHSLFSTPTIRPQLTIYPESVDYPEAIFQVVWQETDFPFTYSISYTGSGFSGTLHFMEN